MVAHTSKVTEIMSDRCAGVCKELIVHFILYFIHGKTLRTGTSTTQLWAVGRPHHTEFCQCWMAVDRPVHHSTLGCGSSTPHRVLPVLDGSGQSHPPLSKKSHHPVNKKCYDHKIMASFAQI
jgi:hypothetical protein